MSGNAKNVVSLVIAFACSMWIGRPSLAEARQASAAASAAASAFIVPCLAPELVPTKLQSNGVPRGAKGTDWWYIVVNFDAVTQTRDGDGLRVKSCVRAGNGDGRETAVIAACDIVGDVRIRRGVATFNGGYVVCDGINIGDAGEAIGIPVLGETKFARKFWMAAKVNLSSAVKDKVPLVRYEPIDLDTTTPGTVSVNVTPTSRSQPEGFAATTSPNGNLQGPGLTIAVKNGIRFAGLFEAQPERPGATNLNYYWRLLGSKQVYKASVTASTTQVGIGNSRLYIGGLPTGERFRGTMDWVVFDPKGGDRE